MFLFTIDKIRNKSKLNFQTKPRLKAQNLKDCAGSDKTTPKRVNQYVNDLTSGNHSRLLWSPENIKKVFLYGNR